MTTKFQWELNYVWVCKSANKMVSPHICVYACPLYMLIITYLLIKYLLENSKIVRRYVRILINVNNFIHFNYVVFFLYYVNRTHFKF